MNFFRLVLFLCVILFPLSAQAETFGTVNFNFDSDQLDAQGQQQVAEIAERLKAVRSYKPTVVVGYTDAVGSSGYNQNLGQRRANTVARALIAAGVPVDEIGQISSRGKNDLLIAVTTADRRNRRVTVGLAEILGACRSYRDIPIAENAAGDELQSDLTDRLQVAASQYQVLTNSGQNGPAFQMAGAAREDCGKAVGLNADSIRKIEYAKRCFCSSARLEAALGR
ncbi:cell envelope biogenesis protein OmpA [Ruegeria sp. ANG-S4]|uniref:OmpA family protein n=1 Tax=Ruegeria sp. ANG-S4 TaxID=1577904 RepID=UPI00057C9FA4|nr:OmpA family protein [Ruegeria sp. ANG-S4]KIC43866.1 cell envelope biogenesis protein OmpA [Ruegeria sp. ANG-S4]